MPACAATMVVRELLLRARLELRYPAIVVFCVAATAKAAEITGEQLFQTKCAVCHGSSWRRDCEASRTVGRQPFRKPIARFDFENDARGRPRHTSEAVC